MRGCSKATCTFSEGTKTCTNLVQGTKVEGTIARLFEGHMHVFTKTCTNLVQGTKVEGTIARLFEGHMHMFIECINVDYKSTRRESFMDLQLDVKVGGMRAAKSHPL